MPLVKKITKSDKRNPQPDMTEVRCEYLFVENDLQLDTFSSKDDKKGHQTIRLTPDAIKQLIEIVSKKFIKAI